MSKMIKSGIPSVKWREGLGCNTNILPLITYGVAGRTLEPETYLSSLFHISYSLRDWKLQHSIYCLLYKCMSWNLDWKDRCIFILSDLIFFFFFKWTLNWKCWHQTAWCHVCRKLSVDGVFFFLHLMPMSIFNILRGIKKIIPRREIEHISGRPGVRQEKKVHSWRLWFSGTMICWFRSVSRITHFPFDFH